LSSREDSTEAIDFCSLDLMLFLFQLNLTAFVLAEDDLNLLQIDLNLSFLIDNINISYYVHQPLG
jgi:hypothetical protein